MKATIENGILTLPNWSFSKPCPRVPHRRYDLASFKAGELEYIVSHNHPRSLFWVRCVGPGFAGPRCKRSATITTRDAGLAAVWVEKVNAGLVAVSP